jgi:MFS superfamily sulfate permease-like transporter
VVQIRPAGRFHVGPRQAAYDRVRRHEEQAIRRAELAPDIRAIAHGVLLLVFALALPAVLNLIPLAVLASVLLVVGYKLANVSLFVSMFRMGPQQYVPFVVTIGGMLATDLLTGVVLGLAVALIVILHKSYINSHFIHIDSEDTPDARHRVRIRFAEQVTFLSRGAILRQLSEIPAGSHVVLDLTRTIAIDHDVLEIVQDFESSAEARDLVVERVDYSAAPDLSLVSVPFPHEPSTNGVSRHAHTYT